MAVIKRQQLPIERQCVLFLGSEMDKRGLSANRFGPKIGVCRSTITNLFDNKARPTLWVLLKMCEGLNIPLSQVLHKAEVRCAPTS